MKFKSFLSNIFLKGVEVENMKIFRKQEQKLGASSCSSATPVIYFDFLNSQILVPNVISGGLVLQQPEAGMGFSARD